MKIRRIEDLLSLIEDDVAEAGSQKALAERLNVSRAHLSEVLSGKKRPGNKILGHYGLNRTVNYASKGEKRRGNGSK